MDGPSVCNSILDSSGDPAVGKTRTLLNSMGFATMHHINALFHSTQCPISLLCNNVFDVQPIEMLQTKCSVVELPLCHRYCLHISQTNHSTKSPTLAVSIQSSHLNDRNFSTFQHYKSQKIITYSSIVYSLLSRIRQGKLDIKLLVSIIDAKTMCSAFNSSIPYIPAYKSTTSLRLKNAQNSR